MATRVALKTLQFGHLSSSHQLIICFHFPWGEVRPALLPILFPVIVFNPSNISSSSILLLYPSPCLSPFSLNVITFSLPHPRILQLVSVISLCPDSFPFQSISFFLLSPQLFLYCASTISKVAITESLCQKSDSSK